MNLILWVEVFCDAMFFGNLLRGNETEVLSPSESQPLTIAVVGGNRISPYKILYFSFLTI